MTANTGPTDAMQPAAAAGQLTAPAWLPQRYLAAGLVAVAVSFVWAYSATVGQLCSSWTNQPDYSHGFLVPILAVFFLWTARDRYPGFAPQLALSGATIVLLSVALRIASGYYYLVPLDGWSIPLWIVGAVWMIGGWPLARWSLASVLFLFFMVPLPFRMERWLSLPLQSIATKLSTWTLQCCGQPAIAEGHTIFLGGHRLEVEEACSGLRMLVGIAAFAVAYTIVFQKSWWERALLLASVVPVALATNTARIAATGLLYQHVSGDAARRFTHDFAGVAMIVVSASLFGGIVWYMNRLFPRRVALSVADVLQAGPAKNRGIDPPGSRVVRR